MPQIIITPAPKLADESPDTIKVVFENLSKLIKTHKRLITYFETICVKLQAEGPEPWLKRREQPMTSPDAYLPSAFDREWMRIIDQLIPHLTDWWQRLDMATKSAPAAGTWLDDPNEYAAKSRSIDLLKALQQLGDVMDGVLPRVIFEQKPDICASKVIQAIALGQLPNFPAYIAAIIDAYDTILALDQSGRMTPNHARAKQSNGAKAKRKKKAKRRGRQRASKEDRQRDEELVADWKEAKSNGRTKEEFCKDRDISVAQLTQAIDRVRHRNKYT